MKNNFVVKVKCYGISNSEKPAIVYAGMNLKRARQVAKQFRGVGIVKSVLVTTRGQV